MKSLFPIFKEFFSDSKEIEDLESCLQNIKFCEWKNVGRTDNFWIEVHNYKNAVGNNPFSKLSSLALSILIQYRLGKVN